MLGKLAGHPKQVIAVAFAHEGRHVVSCSLTGSIQTSDGISGRSIARAALALGHRDQITCVAIGPNGKHIASGRGDGKIQLWYALSGEPAGIILNGRTSEVHCLAFSHDGTRLVSCAQDNSVCLWLYSESRSGTRMSMTYKIDGEHLILSAAFSPTASHFAIGSSNGKISLWSVDVSHEEPPERVVGHKGEVSSICFTRHDNRMVSGSTDGAVRVWNDATLKPRGAVTVECDAPVRRAIISPNGRFVATAEEKSSNIRLWNATTGTLLGAPLVCPDWVAEMSFSPDGQSLVAGCGNGAVCLWNLYR
ncbi:WD40 repeat-like protein [Auricularia subglabra TFB-10046 SS5]|nr:WD40 repeat-like protein [Auricularia subglabra TFB-10046 SS5]